MQEDINLLKKQIAELQAIILNSNFQDRQNFNKLTAKDIFIAENGIRLVHKTPTGASTYVDILHGPSINDAGIKAEVGYTSPNGSLYLSSSPTQPEFINVGGTWTLKNIP